MVELVASEKSYFDITEYTYDAANNTITLTWESDPDATDTATSSTDLINWQTNLGDPVPGNPGTTTHTFDLSQSPTPGQNLYFRIERD